MYTQERVFRNARQRYHFRNLRGFFDLDGAGLCGPVEGGMIDGEGMVGRDPIAGFQEHDVAALPCDRGGSQADQGQNHEAPHGHPPFGAGPARLPGANARCRPYQKRREKIGYGPISSLGEIGWWVPAGRAAVLRRVPVGGMRTSQRGGRPGLVFRNASDVTVLWPIAPATGVAEHWVPYPTTTAALARRRYGDMTRSRFSRPWGHDPEFAAREPNSGHVPHGITCRRGRDRVPVSRPAPLSVNMTSDTEH